MNITPKQRRRAVTTHFYRQKGHSLKNIAALLKVSVATVRADLQLVETHWSQIASAAADDLLLESLYLLQLRLTDVLKGAAIKSNVQFLTPTEYLRAEDAKDTQLTALAREIRRTVQQVHQRAEQRPDQHEDQHEDHDEEQQEAQEPQELAETAPKSAHIEPSDSTISSPEQEIVESEAEQEKISEELDRDAQIDAAIQELFDQFAANEAQAKEISPKTYAEAAG